MKTALMLTLVLLLVASSLMATDTRVFTMGDNNGILLDDANIWLYPSRINFYPDLANIELAGSGEYRIPLGPVEYRYNQGISRIGVNMKFNDDNPYVIGIYLHNQDGYYNSFSPVGIPGHGSVYDDDYYDAESNSNRRGDFFYGRKMGEANVGLRVGFTHSSYKNLSATSYNENAFSQMNIDLGMTLKEGLIDIAVGYERFSFTDMITVNLNQGLGDTTLWGGVDNYKPDGNKKFYIRGRHFHELNSKVTLVPHVEFSSAKYKSEEYDWTAAPAPDSGYYNRLDQTSETTVKDFTFGGGLHYMPASKVLTVLDFGLRTTKIEQDHLNIDEDTTNTSWKWTSLPYFKLGFEASVFRWLDVRFGAESYWTKYTYEQMPSASKATWKYPDNREYLGFGFNWGNFHVDTYANPQLFTNGFQFISGNSTEEMNFSISAVYEMN